jgi:hypothetical protein
MILSLDKITVCHSEVHHYITRAHLCDIIPHIQTPVTYLAIKLVIGIYYFFNTKDKPGIKY